MSVSKVAVPFYPVSESTTIGDKKLLDTCKKDSNVQEVSKKIIKQASDQTLDHESRIELNRQLYISSALEENKGLSPSQAQTMIDNFY
ncbi:MAG: hypothetical protein K940chlam9_01407 [Chlamydiae bacterium]|nr:hypothetical protein [Chlamydiota bacterium]